MVTDAQSERALPCRQPTSSINSFCLLMTLGRSVAERDRLTLDHCVLVRFSPCRCFLPHQLRRGARRISLSRVQGQANRMKGTDPGLFPQQNLFCEAERSQRASPQTIGTNNAVAEWMRDGLGVEMGKRVSFPFPLESRQTVHLVHLSPSPRV